LPGGRNLQLVTRGQQLPATAHADDLVDAESVFDLDVVMPVAGRSVMRAVEPAPVAPQLRAV
jgi:hypothetical protein